jgi:hypothetical protein
MTTDELKVYVMNSPQHYYNKEQVIEFLDKLTSKKTSNTLTLF